MQSNRQPNQKNTGAKRSPIVTIGLAVTLILFVVGLGIGFLRNAKSVEAGSNQNNVSISEEVYSSVLQRGEAVNDDPVETVSRIKVLLDDSPLSVPNGGVISISEDLQLEIFVSPYPPATFDVDVDLFLMSAMEEPVTGAEISVLYDMMFMNHGPFQTAIAEVGGGHYVASYDLYMFGPWVLETYIKAPGGEPSVFLPISIYVWPN